MPNDKGANRELYGDPETEFLPQNKEALFSAPGDFAENAMARLAEMPFMRDMAGRPAEEIYDTGVTRAADNLRFLVEETMWPDASQRAYGWYNTANRLGREMAERAGKDPRAGYGALAAMSPQTDWSINVERAARMMDMRGDDFAVDPAGFRRWAQERSEMRNPGAVYSLGEGALDRITRAPFDELSTDMERYARIVAADGSRNSPYVPTYLPDGSTTGPVQRITWGNSRDTNNALSIIDDPSVENIRRRLNSGGKVTSFYNDIAAPDSGLPNVTTDTHSAGALALYPAGASDNLAATFMGRGTGPGAGRSAPSGVLGLYPVSVDAHVEAARLLGVDRPSGVQSMTWEAVRDLWGGRKKTRALKDEVERIWGNARNMREAQKGILELLQAGRIDEVIEPPPF